MVKASELTYGVEFEIEVPMELREAFSVGEHTQGETNEFLPDGWKVESDGSLTPDSGFFTCEVVSRVLTGEEGLQEVVYVCDLLKQLGAKVNKTMGMHVHVGAKDLPEDKLPALKRNFAKMEMFLFKANGEMADIRYNNRNYRTPYVNRRGRVCDIDYCKPSPRWVEGEDRTDRYRSLNLTNYLNGGQKNTVEFRLWRPTVDAEMAVAAIYASVGLVVNTINRGEIDTGTGTREEILRALFRTPEIDRIVDDVCWDVLLYMTHSQKKAKIR